MRAYDLLVQDIVASPCDAERLLKLYRVATLAEVVAQMVEWDHVDAFLDGDGRLCVPDLQPGGHTRTPVLGSDLGGMLNHYGVESGDLACLRRRMIFEGGWRPDEVAIASGRLFVAQEPKDR